VQPLNTAVQKSTWAHHYRVVCLQVRVCSYCLVESLLVSKITFGGLNRWVSKQELNLLKFSARKMAGKICSTFPEAAAEPEEGAP
jgi:hypothetical protein